MTRYSYKHFEMSFFLEKLQKNYFFYYAFIFNNSLKTVSRHEAELTKSV